MGRTRSSTTSSSVPAMIPLRSLSNVRTAGDLVWFQPALHRLRALRHESDPRLHAFLSADSPVYIARAPGRLDVMGGIADYSGARVLELPLECSTAAVEVAAGAVVAASCDSPMPAVELAAACQAVENHVVGAPCGIMDQMTSACGQRDRLLRLRCQPGTIEGYVDIPEGYRFYGIDSGISHAVAGADYGTVRTAAFMGYRMIAAAAALPAVRDGTRVRVEDPRWGGYLANLTQPEFAAVSSALPEEMSGAEFLERYDGLTDTATQVRPERRYPVRSATEHPIREHERVERFGGLLGVLAEQPHAAVELGRLMDESHNSYGACGLGSDGTDRLVDLVAAEGPE